MSEDNGDLLKHRRKRSLLYFLIGLLLARKGLPVFTHIFYLATIASMLIYYFGWLR
jgi:hypothetical protein